MNVLAVDFINSPTLYLERVKESPVTTIQNGNPIAMLIRPSETPITDSLLGCLKDSEIESAEDIKETRLGA